MAKCAWVTGAGKGIGRATALRLAADGWRIAASARTRDDLLSLQAAAPAGAIEIFPLDITDRDATVKTVQQIERGVGAIELALLNAGTHRPVHAADFAVDDFRYLVETNIMGTVHGLAAVLPIFLARKAGQIGIVASVAGYRGLPGAAAYGCTKAGLINMAEALKPELNEAGVMLSLINPGFVETPLTDKNDFAMPDLITADEAAGYIVRGLEQKRFEVAFPWRFKMIMKLLRIIPNGLFFMISRRMVRTR